MRPAPAALLEITDLVRLHDAAGRPLPVRRDEAAARLREAGQPGAALLVAAMPARDGVLDQDAADALVLRIHRELQRLSEELQQPRRLAEHLARRLPETGATRVVDVGCGLGHVVRWLGAHVPGLDVVGVDLDPALVAEARRLATVEGLDCRFVRGDALAGDGIEDPATTYVVSTGLLHHLRGQELPDFFARHEALGVAGFAHFDPQPGPWTTLGAWIFHRARMREPVSRHDGVVSARRAHPAPVLLAAARAAASYDVGCRDRRGLPLTEVLRPVEGRRR